MQDEIDCVMESTTDLPALRDQTSLTFEIQILIKVKVIDHTEGKATSHKRLMACHMKLPVDIKA